MNEEYPKKIITDYELALESTPKEVRDFLWSDTYKKIVEGIIKTCNLTPSQGEVVSDVLFDLTINAIDDVTARAKLSGVGVSEINQEKIFNLGYEFIISPSISEAEETVDLPETEYAEEEAENKEVLTQNDPLANLATRLSQPSAIAPVKRDYSITSTPTTSTPLATPQKTFDPYRELPEK